MQQMKHNLVCGTRSILGIVLRVSDALALCGLAVASVLVWTLITTALFRLDLPLATFTAYAWMAFVGTISFAWISGAIRDYQTESLP